jgi:hypothetical protein
MQTIKERIDHTLDVFRHLKRQNIIVGLTASDWDELCARVIEDHNATHEDPKLTRDAYEGVPIRHLSAGPSFVAHDFGTPAERRFPVEVLETV